MKNTLSITIFLFLSLVNFAQKDSTENERTPRFGLSVNQSLVRYGFPTSVLLTVQHKKQQFDLGPQFQLGRAITGDHRAIGLEFNYRCYVAGEQHWLIPYLLFNTSYFHDYNAYKSTVYNIGAPDLNGQPAKRSEARNNLALNVGYGIKARLGNGVYLGSNLGVGYQFLNYKATTVLDNGNWSDKYKSVEGNLGFIISVYIGYKFK